MHDLPSRVEPAVAAGEALIFVVSRLIRAAAALATPARIPRDSTLRPGPGTPRWNAVVLAVRPHLRRWGAKSNLGRELGLPPQRINEFFVSRRAAPDAERTLAILHWLATREPAPKAAAVRPPRAEKAPRRRRREVEF